MKLAASGSRGVLWRANVRGTQELRKRGVRRERGDWWIRWACTHGHLHRAAVGPKSLATEEVQRKRLERPCPRHAVKPTSYLLTDVIRECVEAAKASKRTWKNDERCGAFWSERLGKRTLDEITPGDLEKIRTERLGAAVKRRDAEKDDARRRRVAPATVNREFAFLKHVFNVAMVDGKTEKNPVARLKMLREPSGRVRYLSDDEEAALRATLETPGDGNRLTVLLQTGLRKSEFLGLRWRNVDIKAGVLTISRSKNGETRHVPLTSTVRAILGGLARPLNGAALVFPNSEGKTDLRWAEKTFPAAVEAARIEDFRFHDTRHTFASRLAMEGVDLRTIQELGGWKSLTMVGRYSHLSPGHRQTAIERLATRKPEQPPKAMAAGAE